MRPLLHIWSSYSPITSYVCFEYIRYILISACFLWKHSNQYEWHCRYAPALAKDIE